MNEKARARQDRKNAARRRRRREDPEWRERHNASLKRHWANGGKEKKAAYDAKRRTDPVIRDRINTSHRDSYFKRTHGITREQADQLRIAQNNRCRLCGEEFVLPFGVDRRRSVTRKAPHIDHDHTTGRIRGVLCMGCNVALGTLGDTPENIQKVLNYVSLDGESGVDEHW